MTVKTSRAGESAGARLSKRGVKDLGNAGLVASEFRASLADLRDD